MALRAGLAGVLGAGSFFFAVVFRAVVFRAVVFRAVVFRAVVFRAGVVFVFFFAVPPPAFGVDFVRDAAVRERV